MKHHSHAGRGHYLPNSLTVLAVAATMLAAVPHVCAQTIILSDRVGPRIDSTERTYFNLFPSVDGFVSATLAKGSDTSTIVSIVRTQAGTVVDTVRMMIGDSAINELRRYLLLYERLFISDTIRLDWRLLRDIARPNRPFRDDPIALTILTRSGQSIRATVLHANDSLLVISTTEADDPAALIEAGVRILQASDIERVQDARDDIGRMFYTFNVPVGGNDTALRTRVLPLIRSRLFYPGAISPELQRMIDTVNHSISPHAQVSMEQMEREGGGSIGSLINGAESGVRGNESRPRWNAIHLNVTSARILDRDEVLFDQTQVLIPGPEYLSLGADISLLPWLRVGAALDFWQVPEKPIDTTTTFERVSFGTGWRITSSLVPIRRGMLPWFFLNGVEVSVAAGIAHRSIAIERQAVSSVPSVTDIDLANSSDEKTLLGFTASVALTYYPSGSVSFGIALRESRYPTIESEGLAIYYTRLNGTTFMIDGIPKHPISLNSRDLLLTVSIHL